MFLFFLCFVSGFGDRGSLCGPDCPGIHVLDQADLKLERSLPPYHCDQRHALPPSPVLSLLVEMLLLVILAGCLGEPSTGFLATVYNS